ncbi:hypothetical protein KOW79_007276 [Hemibagrus wyckioides]|uniref:Uncharacterized protein n=1 Tax=Hemibagrus wyckioides TaxID=337641 RepID=A0A9D3NYB1_9TELE|nr:hypothetical protein KOW79_007276 [Hemibagrus wyckioides]
MGEDSFELHSVDAELEAVEKQIRDLQLGGSPPRFRSLRRRGSTVTMAFTQAELEQQSSQTTYPGHCAPSDCE